MGELTLRAGLPRPDIFESGGCVTVRFAPSRYVPPQRVATNLTERQRAIFSCLSESSDGRACARFDRRFVECRNGRSKTSWPH